MVFGFWLFEINPEAYFFFLLNGTKTTICFSTPIDVDKNLHEKVQ